MVNLGRERDFLGVLEGKIKEIGNGNACPCQDDDANLTKF